MGLVMRINIGERVLIGDAIIEIRRVGTKAVQMYITAPKETAITREKVLTKHGLSIDKQKLKGE